jgi:hypothetical protein
VCQSEQAFRSGQLNRCFDQAWGGTPQQQARQKSSTPQKAVAQGTREKGSAALIHLHHNTLVAIKRTKVAGSWLRSRCSQYKANAL